MTCGLRLAHELDKKASWGQVRRQEDAVRGTRCRAQDKLPEEGLVGSTVVGGTSAGRFPGVGAQGPAPGPAHP